jgi:hypothetical protein
MSRFPTAPLVITGLIGGFAVARYTGRRELGGIVLAAVGSACGRFGFVVTRRDMMAAASGSSEANHDRIAFVETLATSTTSVDPQATEIH